MEFDYSVPVAPRLRSDGSNCEKWMKEDSWEAYWICFHNDKAKEEERRKREKADRREKRERKVGKKGRKVEVVESESDSEEELNVEEVKEVVLDVELMKAEFTQEQLDEAEAEAVLDLEDFILPSPPLPVLSTIPVYQSASASSSTSSLNSISEEAEEEEEVQEVEILGYSDEWFTQFASAEAEAEDRDTKGSPASIETIDPEDEEYVTDDDEENLEIILHTGTEEVEILDYDEAFFERAAATASSLESLLASASSSLESVTSSAASSTDNLSATEGSEFWATSSASVSHQSSSSSLFSVASTSSAVVQKPAPASASVPISAAAIVAQLASRAKEREEAAAASMIRAQAVLRSLITVSRVLTYRSVSAPSALGRASSASSSEVAIRPAPAHSASAPVIPTQARIEPEVQVQPEEPAEEEVDIPEYPLKLPSRYWVDIARINDWALHHIVPSHAPSSSSAPVEWTYTDFPAWVDTFSETVSFIRRAQSGEEAPTPAVWDNAMLALGRDEWTTSALAGTDHPSSTSSTYAVFGEDFVDWECETVSGDEHEEGAEEDEEALEGGGVDHVFAGLEAALRRDLTESMLGRRANAPMEVIVERPHPSRAAASSRSTASSQRAPKSRVRELVRRVGSALRSLRSGRSRSRSGERTA